MARVIHDPNTVFCLWNNLQSKNLKKDIIRDFDDYIPESYQRDIHNSKAKYRILIGAPGIGKSIVGVIDSLLHLQNRYGNGLIVVPSYNHWRDTISMECQKWYPNKYYIPTTASPGSIKCGDGRRIFIRSAEYPEAIHGLTNITWIWVDEPEDMPWNRHIFDLVKERIHRQRSGPAKLDEDRLLFTGMPALKNGHSWVLEYLIEKAEQGDVQFYFRRASIHECNRLSVERKQEILLENPPGTWGYDRLMGIYRPDPIGIIYPELPELGMNYLKYNILNCDEIGFAADLSRGGRDPFIFGVFGRKGEIWTLFAEYKAFGANEEKMATDLAHLINKLGLFNSKFNMNNDSIVFYHDHDGSIQIGNLANNLKRFNISLNIKNAYKGKNSFFVSLNFVRDLMIKKRFQIANEARASYFDLASYRWKEKGSEPEHAFSHAPDMIRYFLWSYYLEKGASKIYQKGANQLW